MKSRYVEEDGLLFIKLTEDIDHHETEILRRMIDNEVERYMPRKVIFDFSRLLFMDSAGIGLFLGRYKFCKMVGTHMEITNVKPSVKKILEMSGLLKIIPITAGYQNDFLWNACQP